PGTVPAGAGGTRFLVPRSLSLAVGDSAEPVPRSPLPFLGDRFPVPRSPLPFLGDRFPVAEERFPVPRSPLPFLVPDRPRPALPVPCSSVLVFQERFLFPGRLPVPRPRSGAAPRSPLPFLLLCLGNGRQLQPGNEPSELVVVQPRLHRLLFLVPRTVPRAVIVGLGQRGDRTRHP